MKWCREPRCFRRGNVVCRGTSGGRMKGVRYCLAFQDGNWDFPCDAIAGQEAHLAKKLAQSLFKFMSIESVMPSNHSHPLSSPPPPAFNLSQHQGPFQ